MKFKKEWQNNGLKIFVLSAVLLIGLLIFLSYNFIHIFKDNLIRDNSQLLNVLTESINSNLEADRDYLNKVLLSDSDVIKYSVMTENSLDRYVCREQIRQKMRIGLNYLKLSSASFMYFESKNELIQTSVDEIDISLDECLSILNTDGWHIFEHEKKPYLVSFVDNHSGIYVGIMINLEKLYPQKNLYSGIVFFEDDKNISYFEDGMRALPDGKFTVIESALISAPLTFKYAISYNDEFKKLKIMVFAIYSVIILSVLIFAFYIFSRYKSESEMRDTQFNLLRSQANPHFYTNILNMIFYLAQAKEHGLIEDLVISLVKYSKFALRSESRFIKLKSELEYIEEYMKINLIRYPNNFSYDINVGEECMDFEILALTLQPIVENAIKHGMKGDKFHIDITARCTDDGIVLEVTDNGAGCPEDLIKAFNDESYFKKTTAEHIGVANLYKRMKIAGVNGKIIFSTPEGGGTRVQIYIKN